MKRSNLRNGFTLMKVLTILASMVLLTLVMTAVIVAERTKARKNQCICQMRQIVTALNIYRQDYDGAEKGTHYSQLGLPLGIRYLERTGYATDKSLYLCPNRWAYSSPKWGVWWALSSQRWDVEWERLSLQSTSYCDYTSWRGYHNFAVKYSENPEWPAITCDFHVSSSTPRRKRFLLGMSLSGRVLRPLQETMRTKDPGYVPYPNR